MLRSSSSGHYIYMPSWYVTGFESRIFFIRIPFVKKQFYISIFFEKCYLAYYFTWYASLKTKTLISSIKVTVAIYPSNSNNLNVILFSVTFISHTTFSNPHPLLARVSCRGWNLAEEKSENPVQLEEISKMCIGKSPTYRSEILIKIMVNELLLRFKYALPIGKTDLLVVVLRRSSVFMPVQSFSKKHRGYDR